MTQICLPIDVIRVFNPTYTQSNLQNTDTNPESGVIGNDDIETIRAYIEDAEKELEQRTGTKWQLAQRGTNLKSTWPTPDAEVRDAGIYQHLRVDLPDENVVSVEAIEIRDGQDQDDFEVVPSDDYAVDHADGVVQVTRSYFLKLYRKWTDFPGNNIRVKYTYGALGGDESRAGQTTLDASLSSGAMSVGLTEGGRLPPNSQTLLIGDEYVRGEVENGDLSISKRGARGTQDVSHSSGDTVHYCPLYVRRGIAAKAAIDLVMNENSINAISGEYISGSQKMETLQSQWDDLLDSQAGWEMI